MDQVTELVDLATKATQAEFVRQCPFFILFGKLSLIVPVTPGNTGAFRVADDTNPGDWGGEYTVVPEPSTAAAESLLILPVRKLQATFRSMITVGRTRNNDIVLNDVSVSKFHAYFNLVEGGVQLADAGSLVGTWIGDQRLAPKGPPVSVTPGEVIRFAYHELHLLDAAECWGRAREMLDEGRIRR